MGEKLQASPAGSRFPLARVAVAAAALGLAITPAAAALSQRHLNSAVRDFKAGDCAAAVDSAGRALDFMDFRPEPLEIVGYCRSRQDRHADAARALERAVELDPGNWELHYGLAVVRGAGGVDPRPAAARALRLNPLHEDVRRAVRQYGENPRERWPRVAVSLGVPVP